MAQVVEHLPTKCKSLGSNSSTTKETIRRNKWVKIKTKTYLKANHPTKLSIIQISNEKMKYKQKLIYLAIP
jgi:hypothetical protein